MSNSTINPVDYAYGYKKDGAIDLRIALPGRDFSLYRTYNSRVDSGGANLAGKNWMLNVFPVLQAVVPQGETDPQLILTANLGGQGVFRKNGSIWEMAGATAAHFEKTTVTVKSVEWPVYRYIISGHCEIDFYRDKDGSDGGGVTDPSDEYHGLILQERDVYGNTQTYSYHEYTVSGGELPSGHSPTMALRLSVDPDNASAGFLETHVWYDGDGRPVGTWGPNAPGGKITYDGLSRPATFYLTDRKLDDEPGTTGNYADVYDAANFEAEVGDDLVIEQIDLSYISGKGVAYQVTRRLRTHDAGTAAGDLADFSGADLKKAITMYAGVEYDEAYRPRGSSTTSMRSTTTT